MESFNWPASFVIQTPQAVSVTFPLWLVFLAVLLPTLLLWFLDRRQPLPRGQCRCGYNLTGNMSGRCPECGTAL